MWDFKGSSELDGRQVSPLKCTCEWEGGIRINHGSICCRIHSHIFTFSWFILPEFADILLNPVFPLTHWNLSLLYKLRRQRPEKVVMFFPSRSAFPNPPVRRPRGHYGAKKIIKVWDLGISSPRAQTLWHPNFCIVFIYFLLKKLNCTDQGHPIKCNDITEKNMDSNRNFGQRWPAQTPTECDS